jgi:hypothetical protein
MRYKVTSVLFILALFTVMADLWARAQSARDEALIPAASGNTEVPRLVKFSGRLRDINGKPITSVTGVTFLLYKDSQGGTPLWMETQNVEPDKNGSYRVMLGASTAAGLPPELFASGEARWLGVVVAGKDEQPRVLFVSVPYALKAADAETLGGKPLSAFQLVAPQEQEKSSTRSATPAAEQSNEISCSSGTGCKTGFLPEFASNGGSATVSNSIVTQAGAGAAAKIGLGTTSPRARLDVLGSDSSAPAAGAQVSTPTYPQYLLNATSGGSNAKIWRMIGRGTNDFEIQTLNDLYGGEVTAMQINRNGTSIKNVNFPNGNVGIGATAPTHLLEVAANTTQPQIAMVGTGTDAAISLKNVASGGREYWIDSGSGTAGVGAGNFAVWDANAGAARFVIDSSGIVGIGTTAPTEDRLEVDATGPFDIWTIGAQGWNAQFGSGDDGGTGILTLGGVGDGNAGSGSNGGYGIIASGGNGVATDGVGGSFSGGVTSVSGDGVVGIAGTGYAGNFRGDLNVTGAIFAGTKDFRIDHPLDPANKYLVHASVESSEMKDIYDGNVVTDAQGEATVQLPEWFEALNTDFRYQLTVIGQFAQAIVASEIEGHRFTIRTNAPNVKVSWQVTGVRQDAYAKAHPLVVEQEKETRLRGFYIHPELYGVGRDKQIEWARHPDMMKRVKERRQATRPVSQMRSFQRPKIAK